MENIRVSVRLPNFPSFSSELLCNGRSIVSWLTRQTLPAISEVTADSLQKLKSKSDVVVVGYFASGDKDSHEAFASVAEATHEDYLFGITGDEDLARQEQITIPGIVLYKNFDEKKNILEMPYDGQTIFTFVKAASTALVANFHPELHVNYVNVSLENSGMLALGIEFFML